jgi:putative membrane protein
MPIEKCRLLFIKIKIMKNKNLKWLALCVPVMVGFGACTDEQTAGNNLRDTANIGNENRTDNTDRSASLAREEDFVSDVIEANAEELALLRQGSNKGTDPALKSQAQEMISEHEKIDRDMRAYANKNNFRLDGIDTTSMININKKSGNEWDEEWADEVGDRHRAMIRRFDRAQNRIHDTELKGIISEALPSMRSHLDKTEKLEVKLDVKADR